MYQEPVSSQCGAGFCCLESPGMGIDPTKAENTYPAGSGCAGWCADPAEFADGACLLATAYMPIQQYRAGYCPEEALLKGTLFPELVSGFCKEDVIWN